MAVIIGGARRFELRDRDHLGPAARRGRGGRGVGPQGETVAALFTPNLGYVREVRTASPT
jgi:hypothetical protein